MFFYLQTEIISGPQSRRMHAQKSKGHPIDSYRHGLAAKGAHATAGFVSITAETHDVNAPQSRQPSDRRVTATYDNSVHVPADGVKAIQSRRRLASARPPLSQTRTRRSLHDPTSPSRRRVHTVGGISARDTISTVEHARRIGRLTEPSAFLSDVYDVLYANLRQTFERGRSLDPLF